MWRINFGPSASSRRQQFLEACVWSKALVPVQNAANNFSLSQANPFGEACGVEQLSRVIEQLANRTRDRTRVIAYCQAVRQLTLCRSQETGSKGLAGVFSARRYQYRQTTL